MVSLEACSCAVFSALLLLPLYNHHQVGYSPELVYSLAVCQYRAGDLSGAAATLAEVVEAGVQQHPELGIGTQTEGMEVCGEGACGG